MKEIFSVFGNTQKARQENKYATKYRAISQVFSIPKYMMIKNKMMPGYMSKMLMNLGSSSPHPAFPEREGGLNPYTREAASVQER